MKIKLFILTLIVLLVSTSPGLLAQESSDNFLGLKEEGGFQYAYMDFQGPYILIAEKYGIFLDEFHQQGLKSTGQEKMMVVFYNSPHSFQKEDLKWGVWLPIDKDIDVKPPILKREFVKKECAVAIHTGLIRDIQKTNDRLDAFIANNGFETDWPTFEIFDFEPLRVEIIHPVKKK